MPARNAPSVAAGPGRIVKRAALVVGAVAIAAFAVQGGEWGTFDLMAQKGRIARLELAVDSLQHVVDSLKTYRRRIATDPALQERIAREEFGMVRGNKEVLYRFTEPSGAGPRP